MRYCPHCRRLSEEWPDRCRFCARTWNYRICRRGHPNPMNSIFCGECGSADLSTPIIGGKTINRVLGLTHQRPEFQKPILYALFLLILFYVVKNLSLLSTFIITALILLLAGRTALTQLRLRFTSALRRGSRTLTDPKSNKNKKPKQKSRG